ncbi:724_t:CDS:2, partial [Cetraspora pellucida]
DYSKGGIKILFSGKANAQRIARKVKPRTLREIPELSLGNEEQKSKNLVIEGDNLLAMSTLYQYHGKIDLIIADPPYNTGKDFPELEQLKADTNTDTSEKQSKLQAKLEKFKANVGNSKGSSKASGSIYSKEKKKSEKILNINLMLSPKIKLKSGDKVKVITGKYRGTIDFISRLDPKKQMVYLKKVSRKKYDKSTPESKKKSELKEIMTPVYISNVAY